LIWLIAKDVYNYDYIKRNKCLCAFMELWEMELIKNIEIEKSIERIKEN